MCPECSDKLNYKSKKREVKRLKKSQKKKKKKRTERESSSEKESEDEEAPSAPQEPDAIASTSAHPVETEESLWKKGTSEQRYVLCLFPGLLLVGTITW